MNRERATSNGGQEYHGDDQVRDIHALTPPPPLPPPVNQARQGEAWETSSHRLASLFASNEGAPSENFTSISREFNDLVIAGTTIGSGDSENDGGNVGNYLARIGEDEMLEETNPLAIVPDNNPLDPVPSGRRNMIGSSSSMNILAHEEISMQRVKREEIESKISAWQTAKIAKVNNRFKREDAIINGWEGEQVQKASSWMKKVERKLEEKRARALEKMQNKVAKAHQKAEERRTSAEATRGTKVAKVLEIANLMRAIGKAPTKRSFF